MYLTQPGEIQAALTTLSQASRLWIDTETADWDTPSPQISLIQVSDNPNDTSGDSVYLLDVLHHPPCVEDFIRRIMANPDIEKIFHNASYDLRFLGKPRAQNVTCTLKLARKIKKQNLGVPNLKLKTLAAQLCHFTDIETDSQASNWRQRPLSETQIRYAKFDVVYLAQVHRYLLDFANPPSPEKPNPADNSPEGQFPVTLPNHFNATQVRVASECPRLFYLGHHFNSRTLFIPDDSHPSGVGTPFHQLAQAFVQRAVSDSRFTQLLSPSAEQLDPQQVGLAMQQLFYEVEFFPYLKATLDKDPDMGLTLQQIWSGLQGLIRHYAELLQQNRAHCHPDRLIEATFIDSEVKLDATYTLADGTEQQVRGQFDNLVYDCDRQRLCVVEYKTYQPADPSAQLVQVALYADMLHRQKGEPVDASVYCVLPEFHAYHYDWEELNPIIKSVLPQHLQKMREWLAWEPDTPNPPPKTTQRHLCQMCPQQAKCQTYFGVEIEETPIPPPPQLEPTPEPVPPPTPEPSHAESEAMGQQLTEVFNAFGVDVTYEGAAVGPSFVRVRLKPKLGVKVASLLRLSDDLQVQLGMASPPMISPQAGFVSVDIPREPRKFALFEQYVTPQTLPPTAPVRIAIGVNLENRLVEADLSDPNTCHFLVGGTTGSGKSEFLRALVLSLTQRRSPECLKIALVDPKRVTFPEFQKMPWLLSPIVKDSDRAIELMEDLVSEMESRYRAFEMTGCNDLPTYNQYCLQHHKPVKPPIVCIFDEYADFMAEKETAKILELSIKRLGAMARAAGIHLIIATQRPEAQVVTPLIRSNLPGRVALKTASDADSAIILGAKQGQAQHLLGKGDLLYSGGARLQRLQSLFASKVMF